MTSPSTSPTTVPKVVFDILLHLLKLCRHQAPVSAHAWRRGTAADQNDGVPPHPARPPARGHYDHARPFIGPQAFVLKCKQPGDERVMITAPVRMVSSDVVTPAAPVFLLVHQLVPAELCR